MHNIYKALIGGLFGAILFNTAAMATCSSYPHTLTNGTTADASQVMANFDCAALTSGATLDSTTFTGTTSFPGSTTIDSSGNVGIGTSSPAGNSLTLQGDSEAVNVRNGAATEVLVLGTVKSWGGTGNSVTDAAIGAQANLNFYANGSPNPSMVITTAGTSYFAGDVGINTSSPYPNSLTLQGDSEGINVYNSAATEVLGLGTVKSWGGTGHSVTDAAIGANTNLYFYTNGSINPSMVMTTGGSFGIGTTSPAQKLEVNGEIQVDTLASASGTNLCINSNVISSCSSSIRYKEQVKDAPFGLKEVEAMRPVTFKWKGRNEHDLGFIAEEMEKINSLFVTYKGGKVEGVKYPQLTAVLSKAIQQQQTEIAALLSTTKQLKSANDNQSLEIGRLRTQMSALRRKVGIQTAEK